MGMVCNLLRVTPSQLEEYIKNSSLLEKRVYPDGDYVEDPCLIDLDKSWDGIIYLLTEQSAISENTHPLLKVLFSNVSVDEEQDMGYGPAQYITEREVAELNSILSKITLSDLKQKFNPSKMTEADVYPEIWEEGEQAFEYIAEYFKNVQEFYAEAARNKEAIITFIS